ncbi:MAG TPA: peptide chain release factor N(5)-glutamine methyltransferase [Chloroflexota bacterium]|nr:peptide chain release factor N(5)-glutamine methyltransferase [Chloroflexota bacterium]
MNAPPLPATPAPPLVLDATLPDGVTVDAALSWAKRALRAAAVPSPALDALLLLAATLHASKASLLAHPERALTGAEAGQYAAWVARRAQRVPLAYLLGTREFYGRDFLVTPDVLVPRPETELLIEIALDHLRGQAAPGWAADLGTGSGALAVTLAAERPGLRLVATDRSPAALAVAATNAARHAVADRVSLLAADLLGGVVGPLGLVVANLPYIPTAAIDALMPEVARHEPRLALDGGPDGLALNRRLLAEAATRLAPGGLLLLEIGNDQGAALRAEAARRLPGADVAVVTDLAGHDRVLRVRTS